MWEWLAAAVVLLGALWLLPRAVGAMQADARRRGGGGGMAGAMVELQKFVSPSTEHVIEARKEKTQEQAGRGNPPDDDTPQR
ncbi:MULTISPECIES: hypothetical protein [unclassified Brevundimonas]|uniref:hypothetical protein n=1 Tax=unclassified Brevundimonas TaxID=2622653 RepID=UPI003F907949